MIDISLIKGMFTFFPIEKVKKGACIYELHFYLALLYTYLIAYIGHMVGLLLLFGQECPNEKTREEEKKKMSKREQEGSSRIFM